uniref:(northern house mosquito) hypothetical protein n=1 Tax=Culex pipiens TaxID=7175 RepID=A0A8D8D2S5_CULPI
MLATRNERAATSPSFSCWKPTKYSVSRTVEPATTTNYPCKRDHTGTRFGTTRGNLPIQPTTQHRIRIRSMESKALKRSAIGQLSSIVVFSCLLELFCKQSQSANPSLSNANSWTIFPVKMPSSMRKFALKRNRWETMGS